MKNKLFRNVSISVIILAVIFGASYFFVQQTFFGDQVWIPDFGRIKCEPTPVVRTLGSISWDGQSYVCGQDIFAYNGCNYIVKILAGTTGAIKDCPLNSDDCLTARSWSGSEITQEVPVNIAYGRRLYINPDKYLTFGLIGQWTLTEQSDAFKLRQIDHGFEYVADDCKITHVNNLIQVEKDKGVYRVTKDLSGDNVLLPGEIVNYVSAKSPAISGNAVTIQGINNGAPIYVLAPGQYAPIIKGTDDSNFVDMNARQFDAKIQCLPASPYCDDNAQERVNPVGDECNLGAPVGYVAIDDQRNCKTACTGGKLVITQDCKNRLVNGCPSNKPIYNPQNAECESIGTPIIIENSDWAKYIPWIVGGIFGLLLLIIVIKAGKSSGGQAIISSAIKRRVK